MIMQVDVAAGEQFTPPDLPAGVRLTAGVDLRAGQCVVVGHDGRMYPIRWDR